MAISTNSIIHYTKTIDNLLGILETGFFLKYCNENFGGKILHIPNAYPMVCFCDIPLSEVKNHLDLYGHYGIGLTKEWAVEKGLNPVLYLERDSSLTESLMVQAKKILDIKRKGKKNAEAEPSFDVWADGFINLCSFIKNYQGEIVIKRKKILNYRFYNEREWRYVPTKDELNGNESFIFSDTYLKKKDEYNKEVRKIQLQFNIPKDITYLIVKKKDDIHQILDFITQKFKKKLLAADIEVLMTKIITTQQIIEDF